MTAKTIGEIYDTPVAWLTRREINKLDPQSRAWARRWQERRKRQLRCDPHEPRLIGNRRGWHAIRCIHCDIDMSFYGGAGDG